MSTRSKTYSLQSRINRTEAIYGALDEAAYEGNLGMVEVAKFYMNADDSQIQEFESEMDNGNETEAWDIVQRFHSVNLVGIGSDIDTPGVPNQQVAARVDEYFNKKNKKETLTYELLYEMVKDVYLAESGTSIGGKTLFKYATRVKKFIEKIKSNDPKVNSFELLGGGSVRLPADDPMNKELVQKLEKYLETGDLTVVQNEKGNISLSVMTADGNAILTSKLLKTKEFGGGSTGTKATQFEGNLVVAINNAIGSADAEKIEAAMRCGSVDKKSGKCKGKWMDDTPEATAQANLVAKNLVPKINAALPVPIKSIDKNSGGAGGGLSEAYKATGVTSAEPKADLSINADPKLGVSVKKAGGSQYASAQAPEAKAMFEVAYREVNPEGDLEQQIAEIQEYITSTAGRPGLGKFYKLRDKVVSMLTVDSDQHGSRSLQTTYQKVQAKLSGMSMEKGSAARLEVPDEQKEAFALTLQAMTEEGIQPLKRSVQEILVSDRFRISVFKEAATGRGKFQNPGDAANWILGWDPSFPESSSFEELTDEWFKEKYKAGAVNFRMRNRGESEQRGGAFNVDAIKPNEKSMTADDDLQEWWQDDKYYTEDAFSHHVLSESLEQELIEGVLDSVKDALVKVHGSTKAAIDWGLEQVKAFAEAARDYINRFVGILKEAMAKGFGALADFLGFEIAGLEYKI